MMMITEIIKKEIRLTPYVLLIRRYMLNKMGLYNQSQQVRRSIVLFLELYFSLI